MRVNDKAPKSVVVAADLGAFLFFRSQRLFSEIISKMPSLMEKISLALKKIY